METKIFSYEELEDLFLELKRDSKQKIDFIDCDSITFEQFVQLNLPSLFTKTTISLFYNCQSLDKDKLLDFISNHQYKFNLAFHKIDKRSKIYKLLASKYKISFIESLLSGRPKKDFIRTMLIEYGLSTNLTDYLSSVLPDSRSIIYQEIIKFNDVYKSTGNIDLAKKATCSYVNSSDIFEMLNSFFDKSTSRFYYYLSKLEVELNRQHVFILLSKKLMYLIFLSQGDKAEARKYLYVNDYYIDKDIKLAKKCGSTKLIELYSALLNKLGNLYSEKPLYSELSELYKFYIENSNI